MKKFLALLLALAMALSLVACGAKDEPAPSPEPGEPIELVWWTYFGDTNIGYLQNILDRYNASQTKYHATIEYQGSQAEMNAKIGSTAQSELPALFSGAVENVAMYASSDYCTPLQSFIDSDAEGWPELEQTWGSIRAAYQDNDGNQVGYPTGYSYGGIFYNADMFEQAGINAADI